MTHITMSNPQFFPITEDIRTLALEAIRRSGTVLPFEKDGVRVTEELVAMALECLNAEFAKILPILAPAVITDPVPDGLDHCLGQRLNTDGRPLASVVAEMFCQAGIVEKTEVLDRSSHRKVRGIRLLNEWTWHSASVPVTIVRNVTDTGPTVSASWMNLCPVCRTGRLARVSGKQLFGLPHTEYYIECSHCGAKFIPAGEEFQLVSISTIRDPIWKSQLEKTFSPEIWSAIAHNTGREKPHVHKTSAEKTPAESVHKNDGKKGKSGVFLTLKDGSIAVQCGERTLYFKPAKLVITGTVKNSPFSWSQKILKDVLETPPYQHLKNDVASRYPQYLPLRTGLFLWERKERHDPFYRTFLNPYGDEKFCTVRMKESDEASKKGVFLVISGGEIIHGGCCHDSFGKLIGEQFGRISSQDCFLDGDSIRCRINSLLAAKKPDTAIYLHSIADEGERVQVAETLGVL
jgi:hypothetical protein